MTFVLRPHRGVAVRTRLPAHIPRVQAFGRNTITRAETVPSTPSERETRVLDVLWKDYGWLSAYDLVRLSHRKDGAWAKAWAQGADTVIDDDLILHSGDVNGFNPDRTLMASVERVENRYRNALRLLENS